MAATRFTAAAQDGSTAYNWLNITSSSRIYGLGGMNISLVDDDLQSSDQNPALLGPEMSGQVILNYMRYIGGSNFMGLRYGHSLGERAAWAAGIQYLGYGSINETLPDGSSIGDFSPKDVAFSGSFSHDITDRLRGGISLKFLYSSYAEYSAFALATDLGINYYDPERDISLSLVVANLGGQVKRFNDTYERLPFDIRLGWSQVFGNFPIRFSVTAWNLTKWKMPFVDPGDGTSGSEPVIKDSFSSNLFRHLISEQTSYQTVISISVSDITTRHAATCRPTHGVLPRAGRWPEVYEDADSASDWLWLSRTPPPQHLC